MGSQNHIDHQHRHHILPNKVIVTIGSLLLVLTVVTVWIAHVDLGRLNFLIAMAVATTKALLVALFFMGLKYDRVENGVIFATSFIFLAIFIILTGTDLFFRGDVYHREPIASAAKSAKSKYAKPWISTPEFVSHGKELYAVQCATCHGAAGKGDGAAAASLNPRPRDFTTTDGWKNGRKVTGVFKTLKDGLPPSAMASFGTLPVDDRWALTHYVLSLAPNPEADALADFAKIGIDPNKEGGGATEVPEISIALAMEQVAVPEDQAEKTAHLYQPSEGAVSESTQARPGSEIYRVSCQECHGAKGQGGIKVSTLGVRPVAFVTTQPFKTGSETVKSFDAFSKAVIRGLPGNLMPGFGELSAVEMKELYQYIQSVAK